ncbi:MAG: prenyltransferase/squalene oxidase repeat-containing protein [Candidatus Hodarchaeales archaeon]
MSQVLDDEKDSIVSFILSREKTDGGFSFSKMTPATREDTYFAIRTFQIFGINYSYTPTIDFVKSLEIRNESDFRSIYQILFLFRAFKLDINSIKILNIIMERKIHVSRDFNEFFYFLDIKDFLKQNVSSEDIKVLSGLKLSDLNYIKHISHHIHLMSKFKILFDTKHYSEWICLDQNFDGGFGFFHKTTSFLENTFYALSALNVLQSMPRNIDSCESFINRCQTTVGGFGRHSMTVATLEATYYAVKSLMILSEMKMRLKEPNKKKDSSGR